ncbi:DUF3489 domain-containing protein [Maritalea porphyrae]|uniref:DUF3489 domain-containing protein n=1 Tax=Maritalea porphyrae TaxID=880732 RepID=UPI003AFA53A7
MSKALQRSNTNKAQQLAKLLTKPNGAKISTICKRLSWQPHSVRAAVSRLRKSGIKVVASRSKRSGETVYSICASVPEGA